MKQINKTFYIVFFTLVYSIEVKAQTSQEKIVNDFGDCMSAWCKTADDSFREKLDAFVEGEIGCRVNDGFMKIFVEKDETGLLSAGSALMDNYFNCFSHAIEEDLTYSHGVPLWLKDYTEPTAYNDKTEAPLYFVSMDVSSNGSINYSGASLFFVRGRQITKIVDYNDPHSMAKAIMLYSKRNYEEAFRIFRKLAYEDPNNYDAQYYTAVMEIKKQGCGYLNSKVRDMEAAWWLTRGTVANSLSSDWARGRMEKLYMRFSVDEIPLPFNTSGRDFYITSLMTRKLFSAGLMAYKNKGLYGFMNEMGKIVVPCKYTMVFPFDKNGYAMVVKDGKFGYINKQGDEVIPVKYSSGIPEFRNGKTYVLHDETLLLIDDQGNVLKEVGKGYSALCFAFFKGKAYAYHKVAKRYYVHDMEGNITSVENRSFNIDYRKNCYFTEDDHEKRLEEDSFGWQ